MAISYFASKDWEDTLKYSNLLVSSMQNKQVQVAMHERYADSLVSACLFNLVAPQVNSRIQKGEKIYRIGSDLFDALKDVQPTCAVSRISKKWNIIVELPYSVFEHTLEDGSVCNLRALNIFTDEIDQNMLHIQGYGSKDSEFFTALNFTGEDADRNIDTVVKNAWKNSPRSENLDYGMSDKLLRLSFNILLYLGTDEIDLDTVYIFNPHTGQKSGRIKNRYEFNHYSVGFNFKKPKQYRADGCKVSGHFRWQPHGPGFSLLKLIWIDSYSKTFNKDTGV